MLEWYDGVYVDGSACMEIVSRTEGQESWYGDKSRRLCSVVDREEMA